MKPKPIVHLLSGGLDSVVMLYDLHSQGCQIHCALFDYQQRHVQELNWAKHHVHRLGLRFTTFNLPQLKGSELTDGCGGMIVPNRNAVFLSIAVNLAVEAKAESVTFGANLDDASEFPDCRHDFVKAYNAMLKAAEIPVEVCAPYRDKPKWWIVSLGNDLGVNFNETWSCYRGGVQECGVCGACKKRGAAFAETLK